MDFAPVWDQLAHSISQVPRSGLLMAAVVAMLHMPGLCAADIDLSAGMVAR